MRTNLCKYKIACLTLLLSTFALNFNSIKSNVLLSDKVHGHESLSKQDLELMAVFKPMKKNVLQIIDLTSYILNDSFSKMLNTVLLFIQIPATLFWMRNKKTTL